MDQHCKDIRVNILQMVHKAREGHIPSSFCVVEILYSLYANMDKKDIFFLSKGHASAGFYAVLAHFGYIDRSALETYCQYDSQLGGHPQRISGIIMNSSGSLGHGLPMAAGYALSKKIRKEQGRVFCLIGDGESNEGTIWETATYGQQLDLRNFVCIVDKNDSQKRAITSIDLKKKFEAFGWSVREVDGHDIAALADALFGQDAHNTKKPLCIIAHTVKGKGIHVMEENMFTWHHKAPSSDEEFEIFKKELLQ